MILTHSNKDSLYLMLMAFVLISSYVLFRYQPYTFGNADPGWMMIATQSLEQDLDLDLKNQLSNDSRKAEDQISIGKQGEWYPLHEWLLSLIGLPFFMLFGWDGLLLLNVLLCTGIVCLVYEHIKPYQKNLHAAIICIATLTSSNLLYYSYSFSIDVLGCFFFMLTLYLVIQNRYLLSGTSFALTVMSRHFYILTIIAFLCLIATYAKRRNLAFFKLWLSFVVGGLPILVFFLMSNYYMYGSISTISYLNWHVYDLLSNQLVKKVHMFDKSVYTALWSLFISPEHSIWRSSLLLIFGIVFGSQKALKVASELVLFYVIAFFSLLPLELRYENFPGEVGNRYFLMLVPCTAFLLAHTFKNSSIFESQCQF